jgi:hypothetical protein
MRINGECPRPSGRLSHGSRRGDRIGLRRSCSVRPHSG